MDLKNIIKNYMNSVKARFSKKHSEEQLPPDKIQKLADEPYQEVLNWVESSVGKIQKHKGHVYLFENDTEKAVAYKVLENIKQSSHLLPVWNKSGLIEFNGEDINQLVEYINSQLFDEHFQHRVTRLYSVKSIQSFLDQKPKIEENLQYMEPSYLTEKIHEVLEYMNLIEDVVKNADQPLCVKTIRPSQDTIAFASENSHLISVYLSKINKIHIDLNEIAKYFERTSNLRNKQQLDDFISKYNLHNNHFLWVENPNKGSKDLHTVKVTPFGALKQAISAMNQDNLHSFDVYTPTEPDKFIDCVCKLIDGISFKKPENPYNIPNITPIIKQTFAENEVFTKALSGEVPITEENAKKLIEITFDAVKQMIDSSYLSLGINLELEYAPKSPMESALGSNQYTPDLKSVITIYDDTLKTLVETQNNEVILGFIISTIFHETGHAVDSFWNHIARNTPTSDKIKKLKEYAGVDKLKLEDFVFLSCISPSLRQAFDANPLNEADLKPFLDKLNYAEYFDTREEQFARVASANSTKLLYNQLALIFKNDPKILKALEEMYKMADRVSGTYYPYETFEMLDFADDLTTAFFKDITEVPDDLSAVEKLCFDFTETTSSNTEAETLNNKRTKIFQRYYNGLSQENREKLIKKSIQQGRPFLFDQILQNQLFLSTSIIETEDLVSFFREVAKIDFQSRPSSHQTLATSNLTLGFTNDDEFIQKYKAVYDELAQKPEVTSLDLYFQSFLHDIPIEPEKLYDMLMRIPASEKTSPSYYSLISVLHFTKYHKTDSNAEVVKKLEEYLDSELSKKRHARRSRKPVALISGS